MNIPAKFEKKYTNIFLIDSLEPKGMVLLKRGADRAFAPNLYTGIGGKIEKGEDQQTGAKRELWEEAGISDIDLKEFGRIIINGKMLISQFYGIYSSAKLPSCNEGTLEYVPVSSMFTKDIIPTAKVYLEEWATRRWDTQHPFTIFFERKEFENIYSPIISMRVEEGLHYE